MNLPPFIELDGIIPQLKKSSQKASPTGSHQDKTATTESLGFVGVVADRMHLSRLPVVVLCVLFFAESLRQVVRNAKAYLARLARRLAAELDLSPTFAADTKTPSEVRRRVLSAFKLKRTPHV